jgi:hypothetical protein
VDLFLLKRRLSTSGDRASAEGPVYQLIEARTFIRTAPLNSHLNGQFQYREGEKNAG